MNLNVKKTLLLSSILFLGLFIGCVNNNDEDQTITVDNAAEYVAASMAIATYGAVYNMDYVADQILNLVDCNESESQTRTNNETSNDGSINLTSTVTENYSRICSADGTEDIAYTFDIDQMTTSERLLTDNQVLGSWTISGVESASAAYNYNGIYSRGGDWTYNLEDNRIDNVINSFVYTNLKANKSDNVIFEGTATFTLVGSSTIYDPYSYEGDIVFQAGNICIATFSTGEKYQIDLNTGDIEPLQ